VLARGKARKRSGRIRVRGEEGRVGGGNKEEGDGRKRRPAYLIGEMWRWEKKALARRGHEKRSVGTKVSEGREN